MLCQPQKRSGQNTSRMPLEDFRIVNRGEYIGFSTNARPRSICLHHALHHTKIAAGLDVAILEECVGDDYCSLVRFDRYCNGRAMVDASPEDTDSRQNLFLIGKEPNLLPSFILQIVVNVRWNTQMARNVKMIVGRLKIFNPSTARDGNCGVREHRNIRSCICL